MKKSRFNVLQIVSILKEVEIGAKVNVTCRKYGISVADRMGTTTSAISRLESAGKHAPSMASLKKYADAAGCTLKIEFISRLVKRRASAQSGVRADTPKAARRST